MHIYIYIYICIQLYTHIILHYILIYIYTYTYYIILYTYNYAHIFIHIIWSMYTYHIMYTYYIYYIYYILYIYILYILYILYIYYIYINIEPETGVGNGCPAANSCLKLSQLGKGSPDWRLACAKRPSSQQWGVKNETIFRQYPKSELGSLDVKIPPGKFIGTLW